MPFLRARIPDINTIAENEVFCDERRRFRPGTFECVVERFRLVDRIEQLRGTLIGEDRKSAGAQGRQRCVGIEHLGMWRLGGPRVEVAIPPRIVAVPCLGEDDRLVHRAIHVDLREPEPPRVEYEQAGEHRRLEESTRRREKNAPAVGDEVDVAGLQLRSSQRQLPA